MTIDPTHVYITLDGEPKGKGRPRFARASGRAFTPAATRSYEAALRYAAQEEMRGKNPLEGPLKAAVVAYMPIPVSWPKWKQAAARSGEWQAVGKPDADNLLKTLDALQGVAFKDDSQIVAATINKVFSDKPRLEIEIRAIVQARAA